MSETKHLALEAIRKKLVGKKLTYKEIYAIMDEIAEDRLGDILTTYFVASGYSQGFTDEELYFLTRAMVETGDQLHFEGIVADKHSIGGTPGARITMILVPIVAAAGFVIPKSSSRAITTSAGTGDAMEVLSPVTFNKKQIYEIVKKTGGCIVWGGSFKIAPADDEIIRIEEPLLFESFDKVLVSVMAKKVAFGATHVVIDMPYGKSVKVHRKEEAELFAQKFEMLARRFRIKLKVLVRKVEEPVGVGIGPLLEARDSLKVLEQAHDRPLPLEEETLTLAGELLTLCLADSPKKLQEHIESTYKTPRDWAKHILVSGQALSKMREIIKAQGGNENVSSNDLKPGKFKKIVRSEKRGTVSEINNKNIAILTKILGAPRDKEAGMILHVRLKDVVQKDDPLFTLYSDSENRLKEGVDTHDLFPIVEIS